MKFKEYLTLSESLLAPADKNEQFIGVKDNKLTFNDYLRDDKQLRDALQTSALEYEWSTEDYTKIRNLQIPAKSLTGTVTSQTTLKQFMDAPYAALLHFKSIGYHPFVRSATDKSDTVMLSVDGRCYLYQNVGINMTNVPEKFYPVTEKRIDSRYYSLADTFHNLRLEIDRGLLKVEMSKMPSGRSIFAWFPFL